MKLKIKPECRTNDILSQEVIGEVMLYDLKVDKAFLLNPTSSCVWRLCDGTKSVEEIANLVSQEFDETVPEDLVWLALDQFKNNNLLENKDIEKIDFLGMSRREIVKKVGLTSMIALPLVSSIVIPFSVEGASCFPLTVMCVHPPDCCSNCCFDESNLNPQCIPNDPQGSCNP